MTKTCCEEQEKANCFRTKFLKGFEVGLSMAGLTQTRTLGPDERRPARNIAVLSQKFPKIEFKELISLLEDVSSKYDGCCEGDVVQCIHGRENKFNETTEKSLKIVQRECEHFQISGKDDLKYHYLINLTKLAPQLSTEELTFLGKEMVTALTTCCTLSEEFACVDNLVDLVLGELCGINENRSINPAVDHCCKTNFAFRRSCFEGLEADQTYVPPSTSQGLFTFHTGLCQAHNEELQRKKDRILVNLVKLKPELTRVELQSLLVDFTNVVKKCCQAQGPEACFKEEVLPALFPLKSNWFQRKERKTNIPASYRSCGEFRFLRTQ
ncbi:afamin [Pontoporia blainvillei]|uniref:Afamin n=1 Tax=Pontoporia blainvillei TaxID=48723 RepID=A0ABX0S608_PONBL|nr:afamin [Pontoporia blainvillei]